MATRRQQRGYANLNALRKKLKETPDLVKDNVRPAIEKVSQAIKADMISLTPERSGDLRASMSYSISNDGLAALIGPNADKQKTLKRYDKLGISSGGKVATVATMQKISEIGSVFYFRFLDGGTKGSPDRNVPPMPALHIRERALDANSSYMKSEGAFAIKKALQEAATRTGGANE